PLLQELLASDLNDTDPTPFLMNPYQNYHHSACMALVDCYERQGDFRTALRYARLGRDVYRFQSWCGTCLAESARSLPRRIARLELKVGGPDALSAEDLQSLASGGEVLAFAFSPDGQSVVAGTSKGALRTWDAEGQGSRMVVLQGLPDLEALALS